MKNIIVFGDIPITTKCIKMFDKINEINILGVCCKPMESSWRKFQNEISTFEYCKKNNIPILKHDDIINLDPDIGFSIRYGEIISKKIINQFNYGIINTHGGLLPEYRGTYAETHALINNEKEFGVTLHFIDEGIDTGDIIDIKKIKIQDYHTGLDLYLKGEELCYSILEENIMDILNCNVIHKSQEKIIRKNNIETKTYMLSEIEKIKQIPIKKINKPRSQRIIRAFDSPYHEPAYTMIEGKKVYLRYNYYNVSVPKN